MKKNKFMRLASVMLMLCLITTCAISGTFAKYTSSDSTSDSARVAKWGVNVDLSTAGEAFAAYYEDDKLASADGATVVGKDGTNPDDVMAPGTKGTLSTISVTGTPEVTVRVTTNLKLDLSNWVTTWDHDNDGGTTEIQYCPIVFTVGGATYGMKGIVDYTGAAVTNTYDTTADLETAVINAIFTKIYSSDTTHAASPASPYEIGKYAEYNPNHTLNISDTFKWEWAFEGNSDLADTYLGDAALTVNPPEVDFAMQVIVEQVD